ncbi:MAG: autotransporter outer membrane beta-barrel domain-containing protein [Hyphomicrobiaceae bacterium]|nr:autotransporter outer membrane beta-barrel domain-containing protein [Hyphomicrobiaceae bacterium]
MWFASRRRPLKGLLMLGAVVVAPSGAGAQCTDTFNTAFVLAGTPPGAIVPGFALQNQFPLGVGASLNAVVSTMNTVNTAFLSPSSSFVSARGNAQADQLGGGVWGRAVVGTVETQATTTSTVDNSRARATGFDGLPKPLTPVTGTGTCKGELQETYGGYQFGFDLAKLNIGNNGGNAHFGLTAGYISSHTKDTTPGAVFEKTLSDAPGTTYLLSSPAGSFSANTQVAFAGLYGAFTQGNFSADLQLRHDLYLMRLSDPLNGLADQSLTASGVSAGANLTYRLPLPANWFLEPSAGAIWSRVQVGSIQTPGSATFGSINTGAVNIDDIDSVLGRVSLRMGTTIISGETAWQPFVTGSVFHEFAGAATAKSTIGGPVDSNIACTIAPCPASGYYLNDKRDQVMTTSTSRIGTFFQLGVGTAVSFGNSGWLAYGRLDYRGGESLQGYSGNAGLRYSW